jgi:hypothetical protein
MDLLVRGMDPRIQIRIRIHPKMSWIRNTAKKVRKYPEIRAERRLIHDRKPPEQNPLTFFL